MIKLKAMKKDLPHHCGVGVELSIKLHHQILNLPNQENRTPKSKRLNLKSFVLMLVFATILSSGSFIVAQTVTIGSGTTTQNVTQSKFTC